MKRDVAAVYMGVSITAFGKMYEPFIQPTDTNRPVRWDKNELDAHIDRDKSLQDNSRIADDIIDGL